MVNLTRQTSPSNWDSTWANVFRVDTNGYLNWNNVNATSYGLRPILFYNSHTKSRLV